MERHKDWFPTKRDEVLSMADLWRAELPTRGASWGIPAEDIAALGVLTDDARARWEEENDPERRTPVVVQEAKTAFRLLEMKMRYIKRHWLITPPLSPSTLMSLKLPPMDTDPTPIPPPTAQVEGDISFPGVHLVHISRFRPVNGIHSPNIKSDHGVSINYGLTGTPTENHPLRVNQPPTSGKELPEHWYITKGGLRLDLDGESGQTMYVCLRYENSKGQTGPFGPIQQVVVP
ncbi:MAG: hypothetical protein LBG84_02415 [Treponema sp.]|jgi:hypothetical protein|nr:hypothetical protein [Treponema sp.]